MADAFLSEHWSEFGVSSSRDAIIACLHALLVSEKFSHCPPPEGGEQQVLPAGWNLSQELYVIHYKLEDDKYLVKGLAMDEQLVINIMSTDGQKVYTSYVDVREHIQTDSLTSYPGVFKKFTQLCSQLRREIINKLKPQAQPTASAHYMPPRGPPPAHSHVTPDPLMVGGPRVPRHLGDPLREPNPFSVGEADRLPFGGTGGMLMDPFRQGGMPRLPQGVPPGARFDPYSPFHPNMPRGPRPPGQRPYGPDNDHLPPPGYDDMFM